MSLVRGLQSRRKPGKLDLRSCTACLTHETTELNKEDPYVKQITQRQVSTVLNLDPGLQYLKDITKQHQAASNFTASPFVTVLNSACCLPWPGSSLEKMLDEWTHNILQNDPMRMYRAKRDAARRTVASKYSILGFISSGTYGRVYKAQSLAEDGRIHAIKKFKPDKEGDVITYTGISQSAIREIAVRRHTEARVLILISTIFPS